MKKNKSIAEVERAVNDISRPMRWESAEVLAKGLVKRCLDTWVQLNKDLFATLKAISGEESLTYQTLLSRERKKGIAFPYDIKTHKGKKSHVHLVQKKADPKPDDITQLLQKLSFYLRPDQTAAIVNLFNVYSSKYMNSLDPRDREGIFGHYIPRIYQDGYNQAFEEVIKNARRTGNLSLIQDDDANYFFDPERLLIKSYYEDTYQLVTSKVSIAAKGEALGAIADGLENGDSWQDISEAIYQKVGIAYRYHWQRLVRTEMTIMYYNSFVERYRGLNVSYLKFSTSIGACPICTGLVGYYTMGNEPQLTASTHPNCRCIYVPHFRLPKGAKVRA